MDELRASQSSFLRELDLRSQALNEITEMHCGTSRAFNNIIGRFNGSVRAFIQQMLDELQTTVADNVKKTESIDNSARNADIYRESFNTLACATEKLRGHFVELYGTSVRIGLTANQSLKEIQSLRQRNRELEARNARLEAANQRMKEREFALLRTMKSEMSGLDRITDAHNVLVNLADVDELKRKTEELSSENEMLAARCEIQMSRIQGLTDENKRLKEESEKLQDGHGQWKEELEKLQEEHKKLHEQKDKFVDAAQRWKNAYQAQKEKNDEAEKLKEQLEGKDREIKELIEQHELELEAVKELYSARAQQTNPDDGATKHEHHDSPELEEPAIEGDRIIHEESPGEEKPDM